MKYLKKNRILLLVTVLIVISATFSAFSGRGQQESFPGRQKPKKMQEQPERYFGPTVDYDSQEQISTQADDRVVREMRGKRYNLRAPKPFGELPDDTRMYGFNSDMTNLLPAIPAKQSDIIIQGQVLSSRAYLSNDKTGVYSEYTIKIEDILKNSSSSKSPSPDHQIVIEREGGVVRFSSGRLLHYAILNRGLPVNGRQYIFFLKSSDQEQSYIIITGYALEKGIVSPLDVPEQFAAYEGTNADALLKEVREAIKNN